MVARLFQMKLQTECPSGGQKGLGETMDGMSK